MPQPANNAPPPTMSWGKALPVLIVAGLFDLMRMFFVLFWFFGPALAAVVCTIKYTETFSSWTMGLLGVKTAATVCSVVAGGAGVAGAGITGALGVVMSMAVALLGFLTLGLWILVTNARLFRVNTTGSLWFISSFALAEIPFIGAVPAFSIALFRLYHTQIKVEKAALKKFNAEQATRQLQERRQQEAQLMQLQAAQQEQLMEQEAAAEAEEAETAANKEIPEEEQLAA